MTTGFLGTPWLLPALSSIDRDDLAYTMILKKDYPSWGYEIEMGSTTMWERWNSIGPDGSFGDEGMNSFNHYAYGAVGDWMYQNIGGISALKAGYKQSRIAPEVGGGLTSGHGTYESVYGTISSEWKAEGKNLDLDVTIPVNTTSKVVIPAANLTAVTEGGKPLAEVDGVSDVELADGVATFTIGSGSYSFRSDAQMALLGDLLTEVEKVDDRAAALQTAGDLAAGDRTQIGDGLGDVKTSVEDALAAILDGEAAQVSQHLSDGLAAVRTLKAWVASSSIDGPVKGDLTSRIEKLESLFGKGVANNLGVSVVIPPVAESARPGGVIAGTIDLTNNGSGDLTAVRAEIAIDGWKVDPITVRTDLVGAGDTVQLPFTVTVPKHQKPGTYDAAVAATFTSSYGTFTVKDSNPWIAVSTGVDISAVTTVSPADGSDERANLVVSVKNDSDAATSGQVAVTLPEGWTTAVPSQRVTIAAGESKDVTVPVFVGVETAGGASPVEVAFVDNGVVQASKESVITVNLQAPGNTDLPGQLDHVDFGKNASETAHALQASPSSGTNVEAGLDRRYSHTNTPGSWFSAEYQVTPGEPFLIRNLETFDGAKSKKYNIYVDDVLVNELQLKQTAGGQSTKAYQVLVDDPAVLANDGTVRIKYEFPLNAGGFYDPSIADSWILPAPADTLAPLASATVTSNALPGDNGWFRGDAAVAISAVDNRAGAVTVETGEAAGWQPYVAPVAISGDGKHELSYRAKDVLGHSTGERTVEVLIDGTAPGTQLSVTRGSGVDNADKATLKLTANDALSGVAATAYRIDGGAWQQVGADDKPVVEGFGEHVVEFFSTDVAGNPEPVRSMIVDLADVDGIAAIVAPQVVGAAVFGGTLKATTGTWNTKGLTYRYQWLRDGKAISGATGASLSCRPLTWVAGSRSR
ncbi:OmpL47-type beta-barrel domain-containing protein [Aeromicrobium sp. UC242_57]|uniref:alpha-L-rhamnosidase-related protein n=1 Tax=Aeromicrobium sp. UC242_57 TaxID=3374624 RepID=UPI003798F6A5